MNPITRSYLLRNLPRRKRNHPVKIPPTTIRDKPSPKIKGWFESAGGGGALLISGVEVGSSTTLNSGEVEIVGDEVGVEVGKVNEILGGVSLGIYPIRGTGIAQG